MIYCGCSDWKLHAQSFGIKTLYIHVVVGRGFSISFPVSSQDMLKSDNTALVLDVMIDGETTFL